MNRYIIAAASVIAATLAVSASAEDAVASFVGAKGDDASGSASFTQTSAGVLIRIEAAGLPAGQWVALHIHENGVCDAGIDHESAGGHFNPTEAEHGYLAQSGPHAGDMPNIWVDAEGVARAQVLTSLVSLDGGENVIRGKALMIHAQEDDYSSQPSGDAGARLACAVIE